MRKSLFLFIFSVNLIFGQRPIDIAEQTFTLEKKSKKTLCFAFADGDQIVFNYKTVKGKKLSSVLVGEYGQNATYSNANVKEISERYFSVIGKRIYTFEFINTTNSKKVCWVKIQRIPKDESTSRFNTNPMYRSKADTVWETKYNDVVVGYDTEYVKRTKIHELVSVDTIYQSMANESVQVKAGNTQNINLLLPQNSFYPNQYYPSQTSEVIGWAYMINVVQPKTQQNESWKKIVDAAGTAFAGATSGTSAIVAKLCVGGIGFIDETQGDRNIIYNFSGNINGQLLSLANGNVIRSGRKISGAVQGSFNLSLYNDNIFYPATVKVAVGALVLNKKWADVPYTEQRITPIKERHYYNEPKISRYLEPYISE